MPNMENGFIPPVLIEGGGGKVMYASFGNPGGMDS